MARKGQLTPAQFELRDRFAQGLACYRSRRWDEALRAFQAALAVVPDDGPSITFTGRLDKLAANPPAEGWDGSWRLTEK